MVSEFWKTFLVWYETYTSTKLELLVVKILYGTIEDDHLSKFINHLLLLAKYYIYCCSIIEELLSISVYQTIVKNKAEIEKQISLSSNSPERYFNKWKPLIDKQFIR